MELFFWVAIFVYLLHAPRWHDHIPTNGFYYSTDLQVAVTSQSMLEFTNKGCEEKTTS